MKIHFEVEISFLGLMSIGVLPDSLISTPASLDGASGDFSISNFNEQVSVENEPLLASG
jgi:hypothetical protein